MLGNKLWFEWGNIFENLKGINKQKIIKFFERMLIIFVGKMIITKLIGSNTHFDFYSRIVTIKLFIISFIRLIF